MTSVSVLESNCSAELPPSLSGLQGSSETSVSFLSLLASVTSVCIFSLSNSVSLVSGVDEGRTQGMSFSTESSTFKDSLLLSFTVLSSSHCASLLTEFSTFLDTLPAMVESLNRFSLTYRALLPFSTIILFGRLLTGALSLMLTERVPLLSGLVPLGLPPLGVTTGDRIGVLRGNRVLDEGVRNLGSRFIELLVLKVRGFWRTDSWPDDCTALDMGLVTVLLLVYGELVLEMGLLFPGGDLLAVFSSFFGASAASSIPSLTAKCLILCTDDEVL